MTARRRPWLGAAAAGAAALILSGCAAGQAGLAGQAGRAGPAGQAAAGAGTARAAGTAPTGRFAAGGVTVTATLLPGAGRRRDLRVTFRPLRPGFHLYSITLPAGGADGLGIPTRISVRGGLTAAGRPAAGAAVRLLRVAGLPAALPVYPDGPVTFTLPVRLTGPPRAEVVVSYGACSARRCLMPVTGRVIRLALS